MTEFERFLRLTNSDGIRMVLTLNPLLPRLRWFKKLGDFSEDLFEHRDKPRFVWLVRASSAAPNFLKQRRKQAAGGALFFGYFLLSKQKQSDSPVARERPCCNCYLRLLRSSIIAAILRTPLDTGGGKAFSKISNLSKTLRIFMKLSNPPLQLCSNRL